MAMSDWPSPFPRPDHEDLGFPFPDCPTESHPSSLPHFTGLPTLLSPTAAPELGPTEHLATVGYLTTPLWTHAERHIAASLTPSEQLDSQLLALDQAAVMPPPGGSGHHEPQSGPQVLDSSLLYAPPVTATPPQSAISGHYTGLTPLFAKFATGSPTSATSPASGTLGPWPNTVPAPRRRSSVLLNTFQTRSGASPSPATPHSGRPLYTGYFPYPTPSSSASSASSNFIGSQRIPLRRRATTGLVEALQTTSGLPAVKRIHPSPISASPLYPLGAGMAVYEGSEYSYDAMSRDIGPGYQDRGMGPTPLADAKPARFKPTKEQLAILVASYNENKNPDAITRDKLVKQIGGDVKPKTLQIWFQNRRSKARAKEQEAALPALNMAQSEGMPFGDAAETQRKSAVLEALRRLTHDFDPNIVLLPLSVLSVSPWTRFVTPGSESTCPDLGATLSLAPNPRIDLYVAHDGDTYRISFAVSNMTMTSLQLVKGTKGLTDHAAIVFELSAGAAEFWTWSEVANGSDGRWTPIVDFTGGVVSQGGRCDMTGVKEFIVPAYNHIHKLMNADDTPSSSRELSTWRFPVATTPTPSRIIHSAHSTSASLSHSLVDSISIGPSSAGSPSSAEHPATLQYLSFDASSSPVLLPPGPARPHMRQRSLSAPEMQLPISTYLPVTQGAAGISPSPANPETFDSTWALDTVAATNTFALGSSLGVSTASDDTLAPWSALSSSAACWPVEQSGAAVTASNPFEHWETKPLHVDSTESERLMMSPVNNEDSVAEHQQEAYAAQTVEVEELESLR